MYFDSRARDFDTSLRQNRAKIIADTIGKCIRPEYKTAMEFGCGTGLIGMALTDRFDSILFVDSSREMVRKVQEKIPDLPWAKAIQIDLTQETLDRRFDFIFSSMVLHHIIDTPDILSVLFALLNPGGTLVLVDLEPVAPAFHIAEPGYSGHHGFKQSEMAHMLQLAGFGEIQSTAFYKGEKDVGSQLVPYSLFIASARKSNEKCVIISGGRFTPKLNTGNGAFIIACDRGYDYAKRAGIQPHMAVGDFDSYSGEIEPGVAIDRYKSEKDDTDTMIAVRHAVAHGYKDLTLLCALGGRFDHTYANLQAAAFAAQSGMKVTLSDDETVIYAISRQSLQLKRQEGFSLSLFAFTDTCTGVTTKGLKYPLENAVLENTFPVGTSNEWAADEAEITVKDGVLLIILSKLFP